MNLKLLQKLARSNKYQILYNRAKELGTLKLFKNDTGITKIQVWFLYFLEVYNSLYTDLASGEDYISDEVIEDDLRMEAYLLWHRKKREQEKLNKHIDKSDKVTSDEIPTVIFKRK